MPNTPENSTNRENLSPAVYIEKKSIFLEIVNFNPLMPEDLKSQRNLYLTRSELMKLVDFGIREMTKEEKQQLYKNHGFDDFHSD